MGRASAAGGALGAWNEFATTTAATETVNSQDRRESRDPSGQPFYCPSRAGIDACAAATPGRQARTDQQRGQPDRSHRQVSRVFPRPLPILGKPPQHGQHGDRKADNVSLRFPNVALAHDRQVTRNRKASNAGERVA